MEASTSSGLSGDGWKPWVAFGLLWLLQCWVAFQTPLFADEAYYLSWAQNPALGYFDHPPAIAWWVWLSPGHPRLTGLVLLLLAWLFLADAARAWGIRGASWVPALIMGTPLGFSSGVVTTPDGPLLFAWCVLLWGLARKRTWVVGVALAGCLWSKMAVLAMLPGLIVVLGWRGAVGPTSLALLLYAPHLYWSSGNAWLPWSFQASRQGSGFHLLEAFGAQLLVLSPPVFYLVCRAWFVERKSEIQALFWLSFPCFLLWMGAACFLRVEANWTALVWPAGLLLVLKHRGPWFTNSFRVSAAMTVACAIALPFVMTALPLGEGPPRNPSALYQCLSSLGEPSLIAGRYQEMALLEAAGARPSYGKWAGHRSSQYDSGTWVHPDCGYVFIGRTEQMTTRCVGQASTAKACGRDVVVCSCKETEKKEGPSEDGP